MYDNDDFFHGKDRSPLETDFRLLEEFDTSSGEDTGKMLQAGAKRVFKIKVKAHALAQAFGYLKQQLIEPVLIVCESNSLRKVITPAVYLLIKHRHEQDMKPSAAELEKFANKIIFTDGEKHDFSLSELYIDNIGWNLKRI